MSNYNRQFRENNNVSRKGNHKLDIDLRKIKMKRTKIKMKRMKMKMKTKMKTKTKMRVKMKKTRKRNKKGGIIEKVMIYKELIEAINIYDEKAEIVPVVSAVSLPSVPTARPSESPFEKLPLNDPEFGRSPINSQFPQSMSPLNFGGSKFPYGSPQAQNLLKLPFSYGMGATPCGINQGGTCNNLLGSPLAPPNFAGYLDFASFANVTPCNNMNNGYNITNALFGSGNASPIFPGGVCAAFQLQGLTGDSALSKQENKEN